MSKEESLRLQQQTQNRLLGKNLLNSVQPMRELLELNLKTLQNFSYMKPEQLKDLNRPEEILDRNVSLLFDNGHKAIDYFEEAFHILEKHLFTLKEEAVKQTKKEIKRTTRVLHKGLKKRAH